MDEVVRQLGAAVDAALAADLSGAEDVSLVDALDQLEVLARRLAAAHTRVVAQVDARRTANAFGASSTADLLVRRLRVTPADARARVARAAELTERVALTGEVLPPLFPAVSSATRAGEVGSEHASVISSAMDRVPAWVDGAGVQVVESFLVDAARHEHPGALSRTAALLLARLGPDVPPEPDASRRDRGFSLRRHGDGTCSPTGRWNVELTALMTAALDAVSAPAPDAAGVPDPRTAGQRRHDGLIEMLRRLFTAGALPAAGGVPVTVLVRTTLAELASGAGVALTDRAEPWPVGDLLTACSDAELMPVLVDDHGAVLGIGDRGRSGSNGADSALASAAARSGSFGGAPLRLGRTRRLASRAQRLALAVRDGGCAFPGCDRPAAWSEVHHVIAWQHGGATDLDNLVLLCRHHHRGVDRDGWQLQMNRAVPEWIPPPWIDPQRRPLRNRAHHPSELRLAPPTVAAGAAVSEGRRGRHPVPARGSSG